MEDNKRTRKEVPDLKQGIGKDTQNNLISSWKMGVDLWKAVKMKTITPVSPLVGLKYNP